MSFAAAAMRLCHSPRTILSDTTLKITFAGPFEFQMAPERYMEFGGLARALKAAELRNFLVQFPVFSRA